MNTANNGVRAAIVTALTATDATMRELVERTGVPKKQLAPRLTELIRASAVVANGKRVESDVNGYRRQNTIWHFAGFAAAKPTPQVVNAVDESAEAVELRRAIVRELTDRSATIAELASALSQPAETVERRLRELELECDAEEYAVRHDDAPLWLATDEGIRKYNDPRNQQKERKCLRCPRRFMSQGAHHRLCEHCAKVADELACNPVVTA